MSTPQPRRWFSFSLRTLFVVVTVVGGALGWLGWNLRIVRARQEMLNLVDEHGQFSLLVIFDTDLKKIPWIRRRMGDQSVSVIATRDSNPIQRHRLKKLFPEADEIVKAADPEAPLFGDPRHPSQHQEIFPLLPATHY